MIGLVLDTHSNKITLETLFLDMEFRTIYLSYDIKPSSDRYYWSLSDHEQRSIDFDTIDGLICEIAFRSKIIDRQYQHSFFTLPSHLKETMHPFKLAIIDNAVRSTNKGLFIDNHLESQLLLYKNALTFVFEEVHSLYSIMLENCLIFNFADDDRLVGITILDDNISEMINHKTGNFIIYPKQ